MMEKLKGLIANYGNVILLPGGKVDTGEASVIIYSLIANNYPEYCRQLIWEQEGHKSNEIKVIHIASYGKENNDKNEVYHGSYPSGKRSDSNISVIRNMNLLKCKLLRL